MHSIARMSAPRAGPEPVAKAPRGVCVSVVFRGGIGGSSITDGDRLPPFPEHPAAVAARRYRHQDKERIESCAGGGGGTKLFGDAGEQENDAA